MDSLFCLEIAPHKNKKAFTSGVKALALNIIFSTCIEAVNNIQRQYLNLNKTVHYRVSHRERVQGTAIRC